MNLGEDVENAEVLAILVAVIVIGYALYKVYGSVGAGLQAAVTSVTNYVKGISLPLSTSVSGLADDSVIANTGGVTVGQLRTAGWTDDQIGQFINTYDPGASQGISEVPDTVFQTP